MPVWAMAAVLALGCGGGKGTGTTASGEVASDTQIRLTLPEPPAFEEPPSHPDGTLSVTMLRRRSAKFLDTTVKVKGYVVFKYDCAADWEAKEPGNGKKIATEQPDRCDRPHFYLADQPNASYDKAIWVVEVPRAPREDEKKVYSKEELALWAPEPVYTQGQMIVAEGVWSTRSPIGFVNSDGLLVYKGLTVVTQ